MKKKYIVITSIILLVIIFVGAFIYENYNISTSSGEIVINKKSGYDASEEIKEASILILYGITLIVYFKRFYKSF